MPREQQSNPTPNRISLNIITYRIGKEILKDVPPDERYPIFLQKVELMTYREDFIKEVLGLRNEFGIPKLGFDDFDTCIKWAEKITMEIELEYEHRVDDLFKHFNIKPRWKNIIGYFILFDNIDAPHLLPRSVEVCIKPDSLSERSVYIKIQPETTLEDIKNWWSIVQKWKGLLLTGRPLDSIDPLSPEYLKFTEQLPSPVENVHQQSSKKEKVSYPDQTSLENSCIDFKKSTTKKENSPKLGLPRF